MTSSHLRWQPSASTFLPIPCRVAQLTDRQHRLPSRISTDGGIATAHPQLNLTPDLTTTTATAVNYINQFRMVSSNNYGSVVRWIDFGSTEILTSRRSSVQIWVQQFQEALWCIYNPSGDFRLKVSN